MPTSVLSNEISIVIEVKKMKLRIGLQVSNYFQWSDQVQMRHQYHPSSHKD